MKKFNSLIKSFDKFGYYVSLSYNKEGSHHKTLVGGLLSFFTYFIYLSYVGYNMYLMYSYGQNTYSFLERA